MPLTNLRKVGVVLAAATLVPMVALSWLSVRILQQDGAIERQRQRERLEVSAGRIAVEIERQLLHVEEQLTAGKGLQFSDWAGTAAGEGLLYQPATIAADTQGFAALEPGQRQEFERGDLAQAAIHYRSAAQLSDATTRGAALVALGRVLRQQKNYNAAVRAYDDLHGLGNTPVAGQPAALVAIQGRCKVLEAKGDSAGLQECASSLGALLNSGERPVDRETFHFYRDLLGTWGVSVARSAALAKTEAAAVLWREWRAGTMPSRGRRVLHQDGTPVLAVWTGAPDRPALWLKTDEELTSLWRGIWESAGVALSLSDLEGRTVLGDPSRREITLTPDQTHLPFVLSASAALPSSGAQPGWPRAALLGGLLLAFLLTVSAAYLIYRTTTQQLLLARQQSDFVSSVSHEFRTPLTSMRHLTDLLVRRENLSEERRGQYYGLLSQETERLHRMVEGLLSLGRIDACAYAWQLDPADVGQLVADVIDEFRREPMAAGRTVQCRIESGLPSIRMDREAMARAVWNLLENAGKYSPAGSPITVSARRDGDAILLEVEDKGAGIPEVERHTIFNKFVRGAGAQNDRISGVGIGLALVKRIAEAHGGSVRLHASTGGGSTFTLVLPCPEYS